MIGKFTTRFRKALAHRVERLRGWREDRFPQPAEIPRVEPAEFFRRHGLAESPWNRLKLEFEADTGLPTVADREFLFAMIEAL